MLKLFLHRLLVVFLLKVCIVEVGFFVVIDTVIFQLKVVRVVWDICIFQFESLLLKLGPLFMFGSPLFDDLVEGQITLFELV